jgi:hypothetical protein
MTARVATSSPLKVGIIIDSFVQPRWVRKALENVLAAGVATFELVVKVSAEKSSGESLLYKLYRLMDRRMYAAAIDALEPVSIEDLVGALPSAGPDEISAGDLDVLISFVPTELQSKFAGLAKHGVWFYAFGTDEKAPPGFREMLTADPVTFSSLKSLNGHGERVLYQSASPTLSRFSVGLNNNECYWKAAAFVARSLVDLHNGRHERAIEITQPREGSTGPTTVAMGQMFFKLSERAAARAFEKFSSSEQWVLAYRFDGNEFKYLVPPPDRFWADPFSMRAGGKYYIFFEDYVNSVGRAHISVIEVDRNGIVSGPTEVLKMDCHLSYPFVFEWRGDYYMIPETGAKNVVGLYRSASFPFDWKLERVLLEAKHPLDATVMEVNGTWWMFVNIQEDGVLVNWDELHLYYADSLFGPWKPHARNPVVSDVRSARPGGRLFWANDVLYRPSQDSSERYGYATVLNQVTSLSPSEYSEVEVARILPDWDRDVRGVHTLNVSDELTVIDCLTRKRRFGGSKLQPVPGLGMVDDLLGRSAAKGKVSP